MLIWTYIAANAILSGFLNLLVSWLFYVRTDRSIPFLAFWRGAVAPHWASWRDLAG